MYISLLLIWFREIHKKICKKKTSTKYDRKKTTQKRIKCSICLLIEYVFSKKNCEAKNKTKKERMGLTLIENRMYTSAFNGIFAERMVNDKEEFRYLRINAATYHYFFFG